MGALSVKVIFICAIALSVAVGGTAVGADIPGYVARAVADRSRPKVDRDADAHRLPAQTIAFAGVAPGMAIGEFIPGEAYFTRLLSNVVGPKGKIYGIENTSWTNPAFDKMIMSERRNVFYRSWKFGEFELPEKIDLFWITQNYHDLHVACCRVDIAAFNRRVFDALKPGGIYLIVDQAANPGTTEAQITALHRIDEAQVISEVTAAGFKLVDESDALRHPRDDRTKNVFDVIVRGQTDEFMLKFQRP